MYITKLCIQIFQCERNLLSESSATSCAASTSSDDANSQQNLADVDTEEQITAAKSSTSPAKRFRFVSRYIMKPSSTTSSSGGRLCMNVLF